MATAALAHEPGWAGRGYMMGPAFGDCYGGGLCAGPSGPDSKFLDETAGLRRDLHSKKFEYSELLRNRNADPEKVATLEKEIDDLMGKIREKASGDAYGRRGGGCGCRQ